MRKSITALNFLDAFIGASLSIAVPLLMLDRKIDLATIGVVSSILPIIFTSSRVIFASIADQAGVRFFFLLNSLASIAASSAYFLANTSSLFFLGKMLEGLRNASFWSVNRTAIFMGLKLGEREKEAAKMSAVRTFALAAGMALTGLSLQSLSFQPTLFALALLSLLLILPSIKLPNGESHRPDIRTTLGQLDFRRKNPILWKASLVLSIYGIAGTLILSFIMPIFLKEQLSLGYELIGFLLAFHYIVDASATFLGIRLGLSHSKIILAQVLLFCTAALLLPSAASLPQALILIFMLAAGDGLAAIIFESLLADATKGSAALSTDIGLIHVPFHLSISLTLFSAGFLAQNFGFAAVFWLGALFFALYSLLALAFLKRSLPGAALFSLFLRRG